MNQPSFLVLRALSVLASGDRTRAPSRPDRPSRDYQIGLHTVRTRRAPSRSADRDTRPSLLAQGSCGCHGWAPARTGPL